MGKTAGALLFSWLMFAASTISFILKRIEVTSVVTRTLSLIDDTELMTTLTMTR